MSACDTPHLRTDRIHDDWMNGRGEAAYQKVLALERELAKARKQLEHPIAKAAQVTEWMKCEQERDQLRAELAEANEKAERYRLASLKLDAGLAEARETIRTRTAQLDRICSEAFNYDDTISCEHADDYVIRQVAKLLAELAEAKADVLKAHQMACDARHEADRREGVDETLAKANRDNTKLADLLHGAELGRDQLGAELAALREDRARLLEVLQEMVDVGYEFCVDMSENGRSAVEKARAAIDAARKGESK